MSVVGKLQVQSSAEVSAHLDHCSRLIALGGTNHLGVVRGEALEVLASHTIACCHQRVLQQVNGTGAEHNEGCRLRTAHNHLRNCLSHLNRVLSKHVLQGEGLLVHTCADLGLGLVDVEAGVEHTVGTLEHVLVVVAHRGGEHDLLRLLVVLESCEGLLATEHTDGPLVHYVVSLVDEHELRL